MATSGKKPRLRRLHAALPSFVQQSLILTVQIRVFLLGTTGGAFPLNASQHAPQHAPQNAWPAPPFLSKNQIFLVIQLRTPYTATPVSRDTIGTSLQGTRHPVRVLLASELMCIGMPHTRRHGGEVGAAGELSVFTW